MAHATVLQDHVAAMRATWDDAAEGWNANAVRLRPWLAEATTTMIEDAAITAGHTVLDVAAGAGDQTLDVARRVGPGGRVLATDVSPAILAFARENARREGLRNVETVVADAEGLALGEARFDAAVCRLGLMFCRRPEVALAAVLRALKRAARFSAIVFSGPAANPCITSMLGTALRHTGRAPVDPFTPGTLLSLGAPGAIERAFIDAGFSRVRTRVLSAPFRLRNAQEYVSFVRSSGSPIVQILADLEATARGSAWAQMTRELDRFQHGDEWIGPHELLLTSGMRSA